MLDALIRRGPGLDVPVTVVGVVTRPDRPAGRGRRVQTGPVKVRAELASIRVLQPERARRPAEVERILSLRPDVLVVAAYGEILPLELIDAPGYRSLNLHPSLLPRYRGPSPVEAAILEGEATTGTTLMLMTARMDAGPILDQVSIPLSDGDTRETLEERLAVASADLLVRNLPGWVTGAITPTTQDESRATYTQRIAKEDGRIDWSLPASRIARQVRAFVPWPVATTFWGERPLRILRARAVPGDARRGSVVRMPDGRIAAGTGEGLLVLERVQLPGGRVTGIDAFLQGHPELVGSTLA